MADSRIKQIREGAGSFEVSTPDDQSPITGMFSTEHILYVVKKEGLYKIQLADTIDPKRRNERVPNTIQAVLKAGSNDEIVGKVILTAERLCKAEMLDRESFDREAAVEFSLEITEVLLSMRAIKTKLDDFTQSVTTNYNTAVKSNAFTLPTTPNLMADTKSFFFKTNQVFLNMYGLAKLFFPADMKNWFGGLKTKLEQEHGADDRFVQFLDNSDDFLSFIRNCRHCLEHKERGVKEIIIHDFRLTPENTISLPELEILHPETPHPLVGISFFMGSLIDKLVETTELLLAYLADYSVKKIGELPTMVIQLEGEQRRYPHSRFCFGTQMGEQIVQLMN